MQKIGYKFPGERSACYSADLLLRQYKRIRSEQKQKKQGFSYKNIKGVYTIVLFEHSPKEFHDMYLHYFEQVSNTGLTLNLLQKYLFIPLDIFKEKQHNEGDRIDNKLEEVMKMCQSIGDIEKAAGLLGISVDEIQSVLGYNA